MGCRGFWLPTPNLCESGSTFGSLSKYAAGNQHMSMGPTRMALSMLICAHGLQSKLQNRPNCKDVNATMLLFLISVSRAVSAWSCHCVTMWLGVHAALVVSEVGF